MKDLIRVGVADATEQRRIGKRPLERVILAREPLGKFSERRFKRLETAAIDRIQCCLALHYIK